MRELVAHGVRRQHGLEGRAALQGAYEVRVPAERGGRGHGRREGGGGRGGEGGGVVMRVSGRGGTPVVGCFGLEVPAFDADCLLQFKRSSFLLVLLLRAKVSNSSSGSGFAYIYIYTSMYFSCESFFQLFSDNKSDGGTAGGGREGRERYTS